METSGQKAEHRPSVKVFKSQIFPPGCSYATDKTIVRHALVHVPREILQAARHKVSNCAVIVSFLEGVPDRRKFQEWVYALRVIYEIHVRLEEDLSLGFLKLVCKSVEEQRLFLNLSPLSLMGLNASISLFTPDFDSRNPRGLKQLFWVSAMQLSGEEHEIFPYLLAKGVGKVVSTEAIKVKTARGTLSKAIVEIQTDLLTASVSYIDEDGIEHNLPLDLDYCSVRCFKCGNSYHRAGTCQTDTKPGSEAGKEEAHHQKLKAKLPLVVETQFQASLQLSQRELKDNLSLADDSQLKVNLPLVLHQTNASAWPCDRGEIEITDKVIKKKSEGVKSMVEAFKKAVKERREADRSAKGKASSICRSLTPIPGESHRH